MARNLHVYPKAFIDASGWTASVMVRDRDLKTTSQFLHSEAAGFSVTSALLLLKVSFDLIVGDTDTDQDVDDSLFVDDIQPGAGVATVWSNWRDLAETKITALGGDPTEDQFRADWSTSDTNSVRQDARRAMITQRGWTIPVGTIHQHEGDGSVTEE